MKWFKFYFYFLAEGVLLSPLHLLQGKRRISATLNIYVLFLVLQNLLPIQYFYCSHSPLAHLVPSHQHLVDKILFKRMR